MTPVGRGGGEFSPVGGTQSHTGVKIIVYVAITTPNKLTPPLLAVNPIHELFDVNEVP